MSYKEKKLHFCPLGIIFLIFKSGEKKKKKKEKTHSL